jgi:phosphatidylglycerol:prolipoprotein diacylglycerol transferase
MHPVLHVPLLGTAQSHDAMVSLAAAVAAGLGLYWAVRIERVSAGRLTAALVLIALATFSAGRLHFIFASWEHFAREPWRMVSVSSSGLHAPGALLGTVAGSALAAWLLNISLLRLADALAPAIAIGIAVARVGCLLHGCCYGVSCSLAWGISLPADSYVYLRQLEDGTLPVGATRSLPVHPLPLYFTLAALGIAMLLLWLRSRKRYDGQLALLLLFLFSASSALLEPLRADDPMRVYWGPLPQLLWVCAGMSVVAGCLLAAAELSNRRRQPG